MDMQNLLMSLFGKQKSEENDKQYVVLPPYGSNSSPLFGPGQQQQQPKQKNGGMDIMSFLMNILGGQGQQKPGSEGMGSMQNGMGFLMKLLGGA